MTTTKKRVCIIGAGPCGMALMNAFMYAEQEGYKDIPELVCFEKQAEMGGLWNFTWRTGVDEYGESIHSGMYDNLWSNGSKECLEMPDYTFDEHFKKPLPSFPPRAVLREYILGKAKKYGIEKFVRKRHVVRNVEENENGKLEVTYEKLEERKRYTESFDYVCVSTGHYSVPNYPIYPGIESFPGKVVHSHQFRDAKNYENKKVLVIGASLTAEDVAIQLHKFGAKEVVISYRTFPLGNGWPASIKEKPLLTKVNGSTIHFSDGDTWEADAIIFCTGYLHQFPFMSDELKLRTKNCVYPTDLYKGCIFNNKTNVYYLGMQFNIYTFTMFDAEAWLVRDHILGIFKTPPREERNEEINVWVDRMMKIASVIDLFTFQSDFIADLLKVTIQFYNK